MTTDANHATRLPADHEARTRIRNDHATTFIVEAAAGTGKTSVLVDRLVAMLESGDADLGRIVAVTFTDKAAGELTLRLRTALEVSRHGAADPVRRGNVERALEALETARVGTIHGLCADLLRERPIEAGIDPSFTQLSEDESRSLIDRSASELFERTLADPPEGIRRLLRRRSRDDESTLFRIREAAHALIEHRDHRAPWRRDHFDRNAEIDAVLLEVIELAKIVERASDPDGDYLAKGLEPLARLASDLEARERVAHRDHDGLEAALIGLPNAVKWHWRGSGKMFAPNVLRADVFAKRDALQIRLGRFRERADADLAYCLRQDLEPIADRYEAAKRRAGGLDFLDLLLEVKRMLTANKAVRAELQERFTHVFVDEFQDTDPLQSDILLLLASGELDTVDPSKVKPKSGKLFVVGDPKQSIYRFRRADLRTYERTKRQLIDAGAHLLHLTTSFRSLPAIQRTINTAFADAMDTRDASERTALPVYVPLTEWRSHEEGRPSVIALPIPRPYTLGEKREPAKGAIAESTPDAVAAFVAWLVHESGYRVHDPASGSDEQVPIAPRHVCLLFRRISQWWDGADVVRPYVRGLEARRVPHVWIGGRSFHEREEIIALRSVAAAIEYPDDSLSIYAALHGPFLALTDAELLLFRDRVGPLHPLRRFDAHEGDPALRPIIDALQILRECHLARNREPIADTFARFFERTRAHASLALASGGEQALASAMRVLDLARRFDQRGALSFRGFVELLEEQAERGESAGEARSGEEGNEGVRVMTVHRAKGLEFPVVILCDPTASAGGKRAERFTDSATGEFFAPLAGCAPIELLEHSESSAKADRQERVRLTYVAATRARDLLVIPACGDGNVGFEGWLSVFDRAIFPSPSARRASSPAPGCPEFGDDSVLDRPSQVEASPSASVKPGLHATLAGGLGVVWWDPRVWPPAIESADGLRTDDLLRAIPGRDDAGSAHRQWEQTRAEALESGSLASLEAVHVRQRARRPYDAPDHPFSIERVLPDVPDRPAGRRLDALFRSVLVAIDPKDDEETVSRIIRARVQALAADAEEQAAARQAIRAVITHPIFAQSRADRRNVPVVCVDDRGAIVEGTIDVVHEENGLLGAVKILLATSSEVPETTRAEVILLADALARATKTKTRAILVVV